MQTNFMKIRNFSLVFIASLITTILIVYACSKSNGGSTQQPPAGGSVTTISIAAMAFPPTTTVAKGTTVKWVNNDNMTHTATSDDGTTFDSGNIAAGASYSVVASKAGTFTYHCNIHPTMTATLVVNP